MMRQMMKPSTRAGQRVGRVGSAPRPTALPRRSIRVVAIQASTEKRPIAEFSDSIGLPTEEGLFGFKPFSEVWCGRLAMMGFISSVAVELQTGKGTLQQLGITPSNELLIGMLSLFGVATAGAAGYTAFLGLSGRMPSKDADRYRKFLLLDGEDDLIADARAAPTIADKFLTVPNDVAAQASAAVSEQIPTEEQASTSGSADANGAAALSYEDQVFGSGEMKYARTVEMDNGRAAMLGFLSAVLVEAATGKGIIMQLIMWFKFMGLLGPASGF